MRYFTDDEVRKFESLLVRDMPIYQPHKEKEKYRHNIKVNKRRERENECVPTLLNLTSKDTIPLLTAISPAFCSLSALCCSDTLNTVPGSITTDKAKNTV